MKKLISVFLLLILVLTAFASCGDTKDTEQNPQNDPPVTEIPENLNKKDLTKLLLANERLNADLLRNQENIFDHGETVLHNLAAVAAANLVYAKNGAMPLSATAKTEYPLEKGGKLTVEGDTYTWDNFVPYSNSYDYFANITGNIITESRIGADLIDSIKKNVRVVDQWVKQGNIEYYLSVEKNSETLYERTSLENGSYIRMCRRYKNEEGQTVYEIVRFETSPTFEAFTRLYYIPNLRCEYVHHSLSNGESYFDHNFYATKEKGYWEVIDVNGARHTHVNLSYMALKDDIFYDVILNVSPRGTEASLIKIMSPDRRYDYLSVNKTDSVGFFTLSLQGFNGYQKLESVIPADKITDDPENTEGKSAVWTDNHTVLMVYGSEHAPTVYLNNKKTIKLGDSFVNGKVKVERIGVSGSNTIIDNQFYAIYVPYLDIRIEATSFAEQLEYYQAFLNETGLSFINSGVDYVMSGIHLAIEETEQMIRHGKWNGASLESEDEIRKGFLKEEAYEAEFFAAYDAVKNASVVDINDQAAISLLINFSPVTASNNKASYENGTVKLESLTLTVSDTLLFVEGESYTVNLALLSTDPHKKDGIIHVTAPVTVGTSYEKADSFSVNAPALTFELPVLDNGKYTVVAYVTTLDGIRSSQYIPIGFDTVTKDTVSYGAHTVTAEQNDSSELILTYAPLLDIQSTVTVNEEALSYQALYDLIAEEVLHHGIIAKDASLECYDGESDLYVAVTHSEEMLKIGRYRLPYQKENGQSLERGFIIVDVVYEEPTDHEKKS